MALPPKLVGTFLIVTACAASGNYRTDHPAMAGEGMIHVVVEIPAGSCEKWEVTPDGERMALDRIVAYLPYPANYGMIPNTWYGDGDPLDAIVLGPAMQRGDVVVTRPVGILRMLDEGERDDKIICVVGSGPLSDVKDLDDLDQRYPGVREILETWFTYYKGPGRMESMGMEGPAAALETVEASR
jgi:inorganic pyrophosphatase